MLTDTDGMNLPPMQNGTPDDDFSGYVDYYGFDESHIFYLPDGKQWIQFQSLNEGARAKYEASTSRDIKFNRRTDDAAIKMAPAEDRHALIVASVTGWNIVRRDQNTGKWKPVAFSKGSPGAELEKWIAAVNPKIINDLVVAIRKANEWMTEDMTVEMIDEEIARLQEMRQQVIEREAAGKLS